MLLTDSAFAELIKIGFEWSPAISDWLMLFPAIPPLCLSQRDKDVWQINQKNDTSFAFLRSAVSFSSRYITEIVMWTDPFSKQLQKRERKQTQKTRVFDEKSMGRRIIKIFLTIPQYAEVGGSKQMWKILDWLLLGFRRFFSSWNLIGLNSVNRMVNIWVQS